MLIIGPGGDGNNTSQGGGSGAVTVWYGAAQNVPDSLLVTVAKPGTGSTIYYLGTSATPVQLIYANGAASGGGGSAFTANNFSASGFLTSTAGQDGSTTSTISASTTTFLGGGVGSSSGTATGNYGYKNSSSGYFQLQPIIVGVGSGSITGNGGIGCGGSQTGGKGGNGFVLIASW